MTPSPDISDAIALSNAALGRNRPVGRGTLDRANGSRRKRGEPRPGLHARLRRVNGLTPRRVLRSPLRLPVVWGDEFTVDEEALWEEFDTVSAGRFAQPAAGEHGEALRTFGIDSMTLTWNPSWVANPRIRPERLLRDLRMILRKRAVFDLLIVNKPGADFAEFSGFASLRRLAVTLKRGEPDTRYLVMELSSHRRMSARRRRHGKAANLPTTAMLDADDTLRSLANRFYGTGSLWKLIAEANGIKRWGSENPLVKMDRFKVGSRIKIPERPHRGPVRGATITPDGVEVA